MDPLLHEKVNVRAVAGNYHAVLQHIRHPLAALAVFFDDLHLDIRRLKHRGQRSAGTSRADDHEPFQPPGFALNEAGAELFDLRWIADEVGVIPGL